MTTDGRRVGGAQGALLLLAWAGLVALVTMGCSRPRPDLVWVVVDAMSARDVGLYGGAPGTTPFLDGLESDAVVFERAYAQANTTLYSAASYLTGIYPDDALAGARLGPAPSLAALLSAAGYRTGAISENPWIARATGFARSFDSFEQIRTPPGRRLGYRDSRRTVEVALDWLATDPDSQPRFLYLHLLPPHAPYTPPPPFRGRYVPKRASRESAVTRLLTRAGQGSPEARAELDAYVEGRRALRSGEIEFLHDRYRENVAFADGLVGRLVEGIREAGLAESTLIVITSDHGEAFGPHPQLFHGGALYDEQIHVPLLMILPEDLGIETGRRPGPVELVDVVPTLLDLLGIQPSTSFAGESLVPWLRGRGDPPALARSFGVDAQAAIETGWKLIRDAEGDSLFHIEADPHELRDVSADAPAELSRLSALLVARSGGGRDPVVVPLSDERAAELGALGYSVGSGEEQPTP